MNDDQTRYRFCQRCRGVMLWDRERAVKGWRCRSCGVCTSTPEPWAVVLLFLLLAALALFTMAVVRG